MGWRKKVKKGHGLGIRDDRFKSQSKLNVAPPPCFYHELCKGVSVVSKNGKSLCRNCADSFSGVEYPLRTPLVGELLKIDYSLEMIAAWPTV